MLRLAVVKKTKCFEYPYYHFSRFTCKWASIEEGDRRGSNPQPSLEPQSADTCFRVLPDVAELA